MQVEYDGKTYSLDLEDMDTDQARVIERYGVPNLKALEEGVAIGDLKTLIAVYWLMMAQAGQVTRIDTLNIKPVKFVRALARATAAEQAEKDDEADPKEG